MGRLAREKHCDTQVTQEYLCGTCEKSGTANLQEPRRWIESIRSLTTVWGKKYTDVWLVKSLWSMWGVWHKGNIWEACR